jgi:uncharacterized repeat protein (TIGR01451 family)
MSPEIQSRLLTFVLVVFFAPAIAAQNSVTPTVKPTPPGQLIIVNNAPQGAFDPRVGGDLGSDLICYTNNDSAAGTFIVHYFNLLTSTDAAVPNANPATADDNSCDVRGSVVVFVHGVLTNTATPFSILSLDASVVGAQPTELAPPTPGRSDPRIGDQTIVWREFPSATTSVIVAYDRASGTTQPISRATSLVQEPGVSPDGTIAVWEDCTPGPCQTWKATRSNGTWSAQQVVTQAASVDQHSPGTDGTLVAYGNVPLGGPAQIFWQPVAGGTEQVLNLPFAETPAISAGMIAFSSSFSTTSPPTSDVAVYDTKSNVLYNVTQDLIAQGLISPSFTAPGSISVTSDGKVRVVWTSGANSNASTVDAYIFSIGADLAISKSGPQSAIAGSNLTYTITVTNNGPEATNSVIVTDQLPAGTSLVSCSAPNGTCGGTLSAPTISFASLANGASETITLVASTFSSAGGVLSNTATVAGTAPDPNSGNNSSTTSTTLTYGVCLLYDPTRAVKSGAVIPIKLTLCDGSGNDISSSNIVLTATGVVQVSTNAPGLLEQPGNSNPDNNFRFDPTLGSSGGYIFNLKTTGLTTGTYNLTFIAGSDPTIHTASFAVR